MSHQVLSLKYRPQTFDALVGQEHVARILRNALTSGRVGHAYLFVGPRGVGKTTTARIFAKALNCVGHEGRADAGAHAADPCGTCASCRDITATSDLDVVEMDAASNNHVDDVRRLREQVGYATVRSRYRIWIVDEVHMLSLPAFNAFLKTLEEPPERVKFVFCTTEEHKLPETFRSRCQRIEFRPIDAEAITERLRDLVGREGVEAEDGLLEEIASAARGGLRDAESLLEQLIAACPDGVVRRDDLAALAGRAPAAMLDRIREAVDAGDAGAALDAVDAVLAGGCKPGILVEQWLEALRRDLVAAAGEGRGVARIARALDVLLQKRMHLRSGADGVLICQVAAVELARLPDARDLDALIDALRTPAPGGAGITHDAPATPVRTSAAPDVAGRWEDFVERAESTDARLGEALRRVRPGAVADGVVELHVPADEPLAQSTLERRKTILAFRRLARDLLGVELAPRVRVEAAARKTDARPAGPEDHPSVRRVTEATGGRLLDVERTSDTARRPPASED